MYNLVFSPEWFFGVDILFETVSIFISLLISFYSYRIYKFSKDKNHKYFSISFFLIAISFAFKILTYFDIYYSVLRPVRIGSEIVFFNYIYQSGILHLTGIFAFRLLMAMAFLILFLLTEKKHPRKDICLMAFLLIISVFFSISVSYIFNITLAGILLLLCHHFYGNYKKTGRKNKLSVLFAFIFIFASQLSFLLIFFELKFYVVGETLMLIGFLLLLYNYLMVSRK